MSLKLIGLLTFLLLSFLSVNPAVAYIDPNTGGFFFQTVAPFVFGMLGAIVVFWKRIVAFFKGLFTGKKGPDSSDNS